MTYTKQFREFMDTGRGSEQLQYMAWKVAADVGIFDAALDGRLDFTLIYDEPPDLRSMTIGELEDLGEVFYDIYVKMEEL